MNRSVEEILWGYQDPLLKFIADMNISLLDGVLPSDGFFQLEVTFFNGTTTTDLASVVHSRLVNIITCYIDLE